MVSISSAITTTGVHEVNTLTNIQGVDLTGGPSDMLIDASQYSGDATLYGGSGQNTILASSGKDYINGGIGNNYITAGAGLDTLIGGSGQNELIVNSTTDISYTLTNTSLTATGAGITGSQVDPISGFQMAEITSGAASNSSGVKLDASGFSGFSSSTGLGYFNNGQGLGIISGSVVNLTGLLASTALSSLNNGTGVQTASNGGNDFQITLTNGSTADVSLNGAQSLQDVVNDIQNASRNLTVNLNAAGDARRHHRFQRRQRQPRGQLAQQLPGRQRPGNSRHRRRLHAHRLADQRQRERPAHLASQRHEGRRQPRDRDHNPGCHIRD